MSKESWIFQKVALSLLGLVGFFCGIPLSIFWGTRELFLPYLLVVIPIGTYILLRQGAFRFRMTITDKFVAIFFIWCFVSFALNIFFETGVTKNLIEPRVISFLALVGYAVFPYIFARLAIQVDGGVIDYVFGAALGCLCTCVVLLVLYLHAASSEPFLARYEIGRQVPVVVGFLVVLALSLERFKWFQLILLFLGTLIILLSETRIEIGAFVLSVFLIIVSMWKTQKTKAILITMCLFLALTVSLSISKGVIYRYSLFIGEKTKILDEKTKIIKADYSLDMRFKIWKELLSHMTISPEKFLLGYGQLGSGNIGQPLAYPNGYVVKTYSAHGEYMDVFVRSGIVGLLLYLALLFSILMACVKIFRSDTAVNKLFLHVAIGLLGVMIYGLMHETTRYWGFAIIFWMIAGMLSGAVQRVKFEK